MTELHVLCDGYVREGAELRVGSTVGFVADGNALVVIDPGMVAATSSILEPLRALGADLAERLALARASEWIEGEVLP